jgi:tetratricopeptide (TPR) repeat protein
VPDFCGPAARAGGGWLSAFAYGCLLAFLAAPAYSSDYASLKQDLERRLEALQQHLEGSVEQRDVVPARDLVTGWLYHARLTGEPRSYLQARAALAELETRSTTPPCNEQAQLALATHQPELAARALQHCPDRKDAKLLADIALYQGRYSEAAAVMSQLLNTAPLPEYFAWMARWRAYSGSPQEAHALLEAAERRYHNRNAHQLAWFKLQRGIVALEQHDLDRARILFEQAVARLPGWWLAEEHLAETLQLLGDSEAAAALYDRVIASTGAGEFLAARAEIASAQGDNERASGLLLLARQDFERRLQLLPEAVGGHAVEFFLDHGPISTALELARSDYQLRPFGESATLFARALLASGDTARAVEVLAPEVARGWNTEEAHRVLAEARSRL